MKAAFRPFIIALLVVSPAIHGADDPAAAADPVLQQAREATARKDFPAAAAILREAVAKTPENPEYHNLYAYTVRKGPNPNMDLVFQHYSEALRLAPRHRGAHEYIGEAYLMVGNVGKAKEHLVQLDKLCFFGCEEYSSLKKAIQAHEAKGAR
jgi:tetratricopeptide (TPR) repeat protein